MDSECSGQHELYVAEVVAVETEGKLVVITVCRHCDKVTFHEKIVATRHSPMLLIKETSK